MRKSDIVAQYKYEAKEGTYTIEVMQCDGVYGYAAVGANGTYAMCDFGFASVSEAVGTLLFNISIGSTLLEL